MEISNLDLKIWRGDVKGGELASYQVPVREGMVVLDAVLWVQANMAPDLAVRWNCKAAKCGSCSAEVQGFPRLMCKTPIADYGGQVTVRPMKAFPVIKDLVTDVSWNYEVNKQIPPFTPSEKDMSTSEPWRMQQKDVERVGVSQVHRMLPCQTSAMSCVPAPKASMDHGSWSASPISRCIRKTSSTGARCSGTGRPGYCNITKCCTEGVPSTSRSPTTRSSR